MGDLVPMPKRCAYLGCRKAIRIDKGHISVVHDGKHYHSRCYHRFLGGDDPPSGGGQGKGFRRRIAAVNQTHERRQAA